MGMIRAIVGVSIFFLMIGSAYSDSGEHVAHVGTADFSNVGEYDPVAGTGTFRLTSRVVSSTLGPYTCSEEGTFRALGPADPPAADTEGVCDESTFINSAKSDFVATCHFTDSGLTFTYELMATGVSCVPQSCFAQDPISGYYLSQSECMFTSFGMETAMEKDGLSEGTAEGVSQGTLEQMWDADRGLIVTRISGTATFEGTYTLNISEDELLASVPSGMLGGDSYCTAAVPCRAGEGDCDADNECQSGLACVDNVGEKYGFAAPVDVCQPVQLALGHDDYCTMEGEGPCGVGEGDCDSDKECESGLVCVEDVGADYGYRTIVAVCEAP